MTEFGDFGYISTLWMGDVTKCAIFTASQGSHREPVAFVTHNLAQGP